jgi:hypothetical protein
MSDDCLFVAPLNLIKLFFLRSLDEIAKACLCHFEPCSIIVNATPLSITAFSIMRPSITTFSIEGSFVTLNINDAQYKMTHSITTHSFWSNIAEIRYAKCRIGFIILLSVFMLSVIMLSVVGPN